VEHYLNLYFNLKLYFKRHCVIPLIDKIYHGSASETPKAPPKSYPQSAVNNFPGENFAFRKKRRSIPV